MLDALVEAANPLIHLGFQSEHGFKTIVYGNSGAIHGSDHDLNTRSEVKRVGLSPPAFLNVLQAAARK